MISFSDDSGLDKRLFLNELKSNLSTDNQNEATEIISYYDELIRDAVDDGENEADFIAKLGSVALIAASANSHATAIGKLEGKVEINLKKTVSTISRFIALVLTIIGAIIVISLSVGVAIQGLSIAVLAIEDFENAPEGIFAFIRNLGVILTASGMIVLGFGLIVWVIRYIRKLIHKLNFIGHGYGNIKGDHYE